MRVAVGTGVASLFLWLFLRQVRLGDVKEALVGTDTRWILAALIAFVCGYAIRIERWRAMLDINSPGLRWSRCAGPFLASFAVNNVLPLRAGDVLRAFAFNGRLGTTSGVVVATLFVERLLDLLLVLVLLGTTLALFGPDASRFAGVGGWVVLAVSALLLFLLLRPDCFAPGILALARFIKRLSPRLGARIGTEVDQGLATLRELAKGNVMMKLVLWSTAAWLAEGCMFWFAALALPAISAPLPSWFALPVATFATLIPSAPGYAGTFDYFTAQAMAAFGNPKAAATAYALLVHALLWFPPTLLGGMYLLMRSTSAEPRSLAVRS